MSVSEKQLAANRANAQKSTGPRTPRGKNISSLNAMKHGLLSHQVLLKNDPAETESAFRSLLNGFTACFRPEGPRQTMLVERIAICYWRLARIARFEARSLSDTHPEDAAVSTGLPGAQSAPTTRLTRPLLPTPADLEAIVRYEALVDRQLHRAMVEFHCLRTQRPPANPCPAEPWTGPHTKNTQRTHPHRRFHPRQGRRSPRIREKRTHSAIIRRHATR
jgi:hypothetical protein